MLLDEPFGSLDPLTRDRLVQALLKIKMQLNLTTIFVTHDMSEALVLGDQIAVLRDGVLLQVGSARALLESPTDPYVAQLFDTPLRQARAVGRLLAEAQRA